MRYVYGLVLSLPFVVSCSEMDGIFETKDVPYWKREVVIEAAQEGYAIETRTTRQEDGSVFWNPADEISLFFMRGENGGYKFTSQNTEVAEIAEFAGSISGITGGGENLTEDAYFWAVYPYSKENACENNSLITRLPDKQQGLADTFADDLFITVARSLGVKMGFKNVCGGFKFCVSQSGIRSVTLRGNNDEKLSGKVRVAFNESNIPEVTEIIDGQSEITLTAPNGGELEVGKFYHIVALPTAMESGFTMAFHKTDNTCGTYTYTSGVTVKRSKFLVARNFDAGLIFESEEENGPVAPDGLVTIHNAEKGMLLAELMDYDYASIESMKVTGTMNDEDFLIIYYEMPALRYLDISEVNITTLPNRSFYQSTNVETLILPTTLQTIPDNVFCESVVKEVYLNEGLQTIGASAFKNCDRLAAIHIPQSVTTIGKEAFYDCNALESVTFADGCKVSKFEGRTFANTPIVEIRIPAQVASIDSFNETFEGCSSLTTVRFEKNSVLPLMADYFYNCKKLESIEIPASVITIDAKAFSAKSNLKHVYFEANSTLQEIKTSAFSGCCALESIVLPASTQKIYSAAFYNCSSLADVQFEENAQLTDLGYGTDSASSNAGGGVFESCTNLKRIEVPASVKKIHPRAFYGCSGLDEVVFEQDCQLEEIGGGYYFYNPTGLQRCHGAFAYSGVTNIVIPKSVAVIGVGAFCGSALASITFESGSQLKDIQGFYYSDNYSCGAFESTKLTKITLPEGLATIGDSAFNKCDLSSIAFPASLKTIGVKSFAKNSNLTMLNFKSGSQLNTIGDMAFYECGAIHYVYAQSVTNLTSVGANAFYGCDEMRLFKLGTVACPTATASSFGEIGTYSVLKVPTESVNAYKSAAGWKGFASITGLDE